MQISFKHTIQGFIVGNLWVGEEAFKDFSHNCNSYDRRCTWSAEPEKTQNTLAEHVEHIMNDGDFMSDIRLANACLVTTANITRGNKTYMRKRITPLESFKSVSEYIDADWCVPDQYF